MQRSLRMDFHIHTTVSDGTDTPAELLTRVRAAGLTHFSVTDHDAIAGGAAIIPLLKGGDPAFVFGVEFSCRDEAGRYHILGYGYDPVAPSVLDLVGVGHRYRLERVRMRLEYLKKEYGVCFSEEELEGLFALNNPGKPHIAKLMVKKGYVGSIDEAFDLYLNKCKDKGNHIRPEDAIRAISKAGGIPVLAHPSFGSGKERIVGEDMQKRLTRLTDNGLQGVEAFYSGFSKELQEEMIAFADRFHLYVTAGSDYHGTNKSIPLGLTHLGEPSDFPQGLRRFLQNVAFYYG